MVDVLLEQLRMGTSESLDVLGGDDLDDPGAECLVGEVVLVRVPKEQQCRIRIQREHVPRECGDLVERHVRTDHDNALLGAVVDPTRGVVSAADHSQRRSGAGVLVGDERARFGGCTGAIRFPENSHGTHFNQAAGWIRRRDAN